MGGWSQFFFLCFLTFSGLVMASLILVLFMDMDEIKQSAHSMRMAQTIQTIFMFFLPSLAFAYFHEGNSKNYLKAGHFNNIVFLLAVVVLIIVIQPLVNTISYYNHQIILPDSLSSIEQWMKESEQSAERTVNLLFSDKSVSGLIFNLLVVAVMAGLAEEFFFRGCLQQIMQKIFSNKHVAIWVTAIIFSAVHFQFYGFFPRILLGALLGYLFLWSANIWVPVIVHTVHNGFNVVLSYIYYGTPEYEKLDNFSFDQNIVLVLLSFVGSAFIIYFLYRKKQLE